MANFANKSNRSYFILLWYLALLQALKNCISWNSKGSTKTRDLWLHNSWSTSTSTFLGWYTPIRNTIGWFLLWRCDLYINCLYLDDFCRDFNGLSWFGHEISLYPNATNLRIDRFGNRRRFRLAVIMTRHQGFPYRRLSTASRPKNHHAERSIGTNGCTLKEQGDVMITLYRVCH